MLDESLFAGEGINDIDPPAVHERGVARRAPAASAHRRDPGSLHRREIRLHRGRIRPGRRPVARGAARRAAARRGSVRDRLQVLRRARLRVPAGHHPPRHQARQPDGGRRARTIKIVDFGAALLTNTQHTQIQDVGTPSYMSPEQVRGGEALSFQSDMFSLGVVLYGLFTGQRPVHRRVGARAAAQHRREGAAAAERMAPGAGPRGGPHPDAHAAQGAGEALPELGRPRLRPGRHRPLQRLREGNLGPREIHRAARLRAAGEAERRRNLGAGARQLLGARARADHHHEGGRQGRRAAVPRQRRSQGGEAGPAAERAAHRLLLRRNGARQGGRDAAPGHGGDAHRRADRRIPPRRDEEAEHSTASCSCRCRCSTRWSTGSPSPTSASRTRSVSSARYRARRRRPPAGPRR